MKKLLTVLLTVAMLFTALTAFAEEAGTTLNLAEIGMFSAGGTVTEPVEGDYDPTQNWMDVNRPGNTAHVDHANVLYMIPALGCGPRDTLMVIVGKKFPKAPIGAAKFGIDVFALAIGVLLGAPFGIGTVLVMALQAGIFQFACRVCRFEPRSVNHEDVLDTIRRIRSS